MESLLKTWNEGLASGGMTSTTHFKPMTNNNKVNTPAKESVLKQATTGVAFALAPFAIVASIAGIAAIDTPSAEAAFTCRTTYTSYGSRTSCY